MEHIITLCLLTDTARRKRFTLYVTFVASRKHNMTKCLEIFCLLKLLECCILMLSAIIVMYRVTLCVIGTAVVNTSIWVRQGSPMSCLLFVLFVNDLIKMI